MSVNLMIFWGVLAIFFIIVELSTLALVSIWFVVGSIAAFFCAMAGVPFLWQCIVFTVLAVLVFCLTRPFVKRVKPVKTPTNADQLIGMEGETLSEIENIRGEGRVYVNNQDWRALSTTGEPISAKTRVVIDRLQGVTLYVTPVQNASK